MHNGKLVEGESLKPDPVTGKPRTKKQAEEKLRELLRTAGTPDHVGPDVQRITFADLCAGIRADYARKKNRSTVRLEQTLLHLTAAFGTRRALQITDPAVLTYITQRQAAGAEDATINRELASLRRMFKLNKHVRRYAPEIRLLDEADNVREGFIDPPEFAALLAALRERDEPAVADLVEFAYLTLMRRRNVLGLHWLNVTPRLDAHGHVVGGHIRLPGATTKNRKPLSLTLRGRLLEVIRRRWAARVPACPFVFHRAGRRIVTFLGAWETACAAIGLPGLILHDLRRSGARNLRRAGVPESVIQRMGGWKTRSMFLRYAICDDRDLEQAADAYDTFLDTTTTGERVVIPLAVGESVSLRERRISPDSREKTLATKGSFPCP
jgi:integrase